MTPYLLFLAYMAAVIGVSFWAGMSHERRRTLKAIRGQAILQAQARRQIENKAFREGLIFAKITQRRNSGVN